MVVGGGGFGGSVAGAGVNASEVCGDDVAVVAVVTWQRGGGGPALITLVGCRSRRMRRVGSRAVVAGGGCEVVLVLAVVFRVTVQVCMRARWDAVMTWAGVDSIAAFGDVEGESVAASAGGWIVGAMGGGCRVLRLRHWLARKTEERARAHLKPAPVLFSFPFPYPYPYLSLSLSLPSLQWLWPWS